MTQEEFERTQNSIIKQMLETCFEYVDFNRKEVEKIYLFGYYLQGRMRSISRFYKIKGKITGNRDVNEFLIKKCDNSDDAQLQLLDDLDEDFIALMDLFFEHQKDCPIVMKVEYSLSGKLNVSYEYDKEKFDNGKTHYSDFKLNWINELKNE